MNHKLTADLYHQMPRIRHFKEDMTHLYISPNDIKCFLKDAFRNDDSV